ncbi:hypothetical protein E2C01_072956 [Portunus trituberculatus]|uniref:Uncharacterized protein n=1 Tax=Portunus trituberculatus TaxID=210409 RepID=A0A5B7I9A5_PORTR|nr:hypothetical protein [Portunus trituberculatus]
MEKSNGTGEARHLQLLPQAGGHRITGGPDRPHAGSGELGRRREPDWPAASIQAQSRVGDSGARLLAGRTDSP